ncbi:MAG: hypothetical protein Tsb002_35330 [Wenzhouxiangellaceae bacterium]
MPKPDQQHPRSIDDVCGDAGGDDAHGFDHLLRQAQAYQRLNRYVLEQIPQPLRDHCQLACIRGETAVIVADNAVWATQARLHSPVWLDAVSKFWPGRIRQLNFRVQSRPQRSAPAARPRQLSGTVRDHLEHCAASERDPEMAAIYQRLAQLSGES